MRLMTINIFPCRLRWALGLYLTAAVALSHAAEQPLANSNGPPTALEALVADVLARNPELNFYRAEIDAVKGERRTAGNLANPELSATGGDKRVVNKSVVSEGVAWSVSVRQTLDWPGRIPLRKAIANHQIKLAELGFDQFRAALAARARTLAFNLFAAQEKALASREVADRLQAVREVLVQRDPAGLTPLLETRIIEATELSLQRRAGEATAAAQSANFELNQLRGDSWRSEFKVQPPSLRFPALPDTDALLASALTNNFELQMRRVELAQQGLKVALARNEQKPGVAIGPYLSEERAGDRETQVGIGITLPLPLWNRNSGKIETEKARQEQGATALLLTQRQLERQIMEKAFLYQTKVQEMARWREDSIQQFKDAAALADRHYRLGAVPIATYVELQKQYLEAVSALLDTQRDALEAGQELERLTGLDFNQTGISGANRPEN